MNDWIVEFAVCGTCLLSGLCAVSWWIRRSPAATRNAVWVTGLVGLLALTLMLAMLPKLHIVPNPFSRGAAQNPADSVESLVAPEAPEPYSMQMNSDSVKAASTTEEERLTVVESVEAVRLPSVASHAATPADSLDFTTDVSTVWLAGCLLALARLVLARNWLFRVARNDGRCGDVTTLKEVTRCGIGF